MPRFCAIKLKPVASALLAAATCIAMACDVSMSVRFRLVSVPTLEQYYYQLLIAMNRGLPDPNPKEECRCGESIHDRTSEILDTFLQDARKASSKV